MQVLVVDDDMAIVDVIKNTVNWEKLGIGQVFAAYNIERAKEILKDEAIDIVISDIEMPQGSGLDLLSWIREEEMEAEFILLTCHERFDYATNAVKLHAAEYLLKPFDTEVMEQALRKRMIQIEETRALKEESTYGRWMKKNRRQLQLDFWNMVLDGRISNHQEKIREEIQNRRLEVSLDGEYTLVISKITDCENDRERMNSNLLMFIVENIHSEVLCGTPENMFVIRYDFKDYYVFITICKETNPKRLRQMCELLITECKNILTSTVTCCISRPCTIYEFYDTYHKNLNLITTNVVYYGTFFFAEQAAEAAVQETFVLEFAVMEEFLNQKKKMDFMSYLKQRLNDKAYEKKLNEQMLVQAKQEVLQVIYTYLAKRDIQASGLFVDEVSAGLTQKASQSVINMLRWANYMVEQTYKYEGEVQKSHSIIDKINLYIREHYMEDIGRNEIAAKFFLAPEYLSKMYKKQTGKSLKEYISEYRIEQAKILLKKGEMMVSDVAEAVGFDNFTYFSTTFKKYTGMTPNQYRKE